MTAMNTSSDQAVVERRRFLKQALAVTAGGTLAAAAAGSARATDILPSPGTVVDTGMEVTGAVMTSSQGPVQRAVLHFVGRRRQRVMVGAADHVRLETLDFTAQAAHPQFGMITMRVPDIHDRDGGVLKALGSGQLQETWLVRPTLWFDRWGDMPGPVECTAEGQLALVGSSAQWPPPPPGATYALQSPVAFSNGDLRVEFTEFPANISG
jgi:hypothetical protein